MKIRYANAILLTSLLAMPVTALAEFNAAVDFSRTLNPNGVWQYGWSQTLGSNFTLDTIHQVSQGVDFWNGPLQTESPPGRFPTVFHNGTASTIAYTSTATISAGGMGMHPGPDGQYAVVLFTAGATGNYLISASFAGIDLTSTDVHVLVNSTSYFDAQVNGRGNVKSFSSNRSLLRGDTIEFAVGYGADGRYFNDSTGFNAQVSQVPEPSTVLMSGAGLVLAGWLRRRRTQEPASGVSRLASDA